MCQATGLDISQKIVEKSQQEELTRGLDQMAGGCRPHQSHLKSRHPPRHRWRPGYQMTQLNVVINYHSPSFLAMIYHFLACPNG